MNKPIIIPPVEPIEDLVEALKRIGAKHNVITIPPMRYKEMQEKMEELASTKTLTVIKHRKVDLEALWEPLNRLDENE